MAEETTLWHSHRLRKARPGETIVGALGGHPRGVRAHEWPRCAVCGAPMCHMAQIEAGYWAKLEGFARMSLFICHATGGRCEDWDPWKGSNRVVLHPTRDDTLFDGPPTVRVYRRVRLSVDEACNERDVIDRAKQQEMDQALEQLRHDKLGGGAVWLHGDSTPHSLEGEGPMRLVMQLTTRLVRFDITPGGMAYVFIDPHDKTENAGRMLWQGS